MSFAPIRFASLSLLATGLLAAGCGGGGGAKTSQELGDRVLAALQAKDYAKLEPLVMTVDTFTKNCPEVPADEVAKMKEKFGKHIDELKASFGECGKIDFANAKIVSSDGGDDKKPLKDCKDVIKVRDLKLTLDVGGKKVKVKIDDPLRAGGAIYLTGEIDCEAGGGLCADAIDNIQKIGATASDEMIKKAVSDPSMLEQMKSMCESQKDGPQRALFECLAKATNEADLKGCDKHADGAKKDEAAPSAGGADKPADPTPAPAPAPGGDKPADAPPAPAPAAGGDTGAPNCDKYIKSMEACMAKMPEAAQGPMKDGLKQAKDAWKGITDKTALDAACKSALDSGKQAMAQMCPDVKWE